MKIYEINGEARVAPLVEGDRVDLSGLNLSNAVFKGDWRFSNFTGANLTGANFSEAQLAASSFTNANLLKANFRGANLRHTVMTGVRAPYAVFSDADLSGALLQNAVLEWADVQNACFADTRLTNVNFEDVPWVRAFYGVAEYGPAFIFSEKWIKIGCRWLTLEEALVHWNGVDCRVDTLALVKFCAAQGFIK